MEVHLEASLCSQV
ncbi:hypothetical protein LINGRAHAP2_LOCUS18445 [Linum grandiflorum]